MKIKLSDIKPGSIRNEVLPEGFIKRVIKFKKILKDVEKTSLELTINNFQKDLEPEKEIIVWENIARVYEKTLKKIKNPTLKDKKDLFKKILMQSLGC